MLKNSILVSVVTLLPLFAFAEGQQKQWNESAPVKQEALHLAGSVKRGEKLYKADCAQCHGSQGNGSPDGKYPVLAHQFHTVLIKQIEDIKLGNRDNPEMAPHLTRLNTAQEVADVAEYLSSLPRATGNRKGPDDQKDIAKGAQIYHTKCASCHNHDGSGDIGKFYPLISNQHYEYLVKQAIETRDGKRKNAKPDMAEALQGMNDEDIKSVSNYVSRIKFEVKK